MDTISVLIADDNADFRDGLRLLLNSVDDMKLVGEATTGQEALAQSMQLLPDVVLMDLQMPVIDGIEATRRITTTSPHIGVLVLTMFEDDESVFAAMRAGARGYLLKGARQNEILRAIRAVYSGEAIFGAPIARRLLNYITTPRTRLPNTVFPELSLRELEILDLIARGYNNSEIAEHFVLSPKTVRNHVSNVFHKLEVADRAEAILRARHAGLGQDA